MFGKSFQIARIAGIGIEIHPSWLLILVFVAWTLSAGYFPDLYDWSTAVYWAVGIIAAVLLFVTVLVHELAHAFVAKHRGLDVPKITLFIFGGVSHLSRQPSSAGEEFQIAAAGPATSIVIAIVTAIAGWALQDVSEQTSAVLLYLAVVNVLLGVFNILPGFPLDGGRVFRSIVWKRTGSFRKATQTASGVGELFGYLLMLIGVFLLLTGFVFNGVWLLFIGWFLLGAAKAEAGNLQLETILGKLTARDVMHEGFSTVQPGIPIQDVVDDHMLGHGERAVVVANDGAVLGILSVNDVRRAPRDQWPHIPAQALMTPREKVVTVDANRRALDVMLLLGEKRLNQVPVLEDGRMIGLVTRRELMERIQLAESLAPDQPLPPEPEHEHEKTPPPSAKV